MKFYYSILKISPNTSSGDAISIGLLAFDSERAIVCFSESRKSLAKKLVNPNLIDFFCKQIQTKVKEVNKSHKNDLKSLFKNDFVFETTYIDYLSNYSNGLIQVSKSNVFLSKLNDSNFEILFETVIEKIEIKPAHKTKSINFVKVVQDKLINRVKDKVHTNIHIDNTLIPSLFFSYDLDCIGKNGVFVGAKSIDFTNKKNTLDGTISHYSSLIAVLSANHSKDIAKNNFYLIAEEPALTSVPEYEIWDTIQHNPLFKVIHPEQADIVADKIEKSKATKFFN